MWRRWWWWWRENLFVDGKIYRINEEVEVEEGNKIENGEG